MNSYFPLLQSSTTPPSVCSTFFLQTLFPVAAACSEMEFDPCKLEVLMHNITCICLTILAIYKLQAVLINLVMTFNYIASALFGGGEVQRVTVKYVYIREIFINVWREKKQIC